MTLDDEAPAASALSDREAFAALGNETRLRILQALGEAGEPLSFSDLRGLVGTRDSGQFNYHLGKLEGHFIARTDDGYRLRRAGSRIVEAISSGTVTDSPVVPRTPIDGECPYCDAPIEARYHQERLELFCSECSGTWGGDRPDHWGYLGFHSLPPAGLERRTLEEAARAAWTWQNLRILSISSGICPSCSAAIDRWAEVCGDHDPVDGHCGRCNRRHAAQYRFRCTNCIFEGGGNFAVHLAANTDLLALLIAHGLDPIAPERISAVERVHSDYEEEILSTEPFGARFRFTVGDDALTLTVGEDLSVVDATADPEPGAAT
ncbi:MAG: ArsR/SmtB family transcription factor [Haloarculaceae archaeon]